jgi:hypothetical protein
MVLLSPSHPPPPPPSPLPLPTLRRYLNILQTHGFPKIFGVLTHLDKFKTAKALRQQKKALKHRFWTEIYQGAKMFYMNGMVNKKYLQCVREARRGERE